jgi:hypothetical protein
MNTGVVFATTGGSTIIRAVRSFKQSHPDIDVHVIIDVSSNTWSKTDQSSILSWLNNNNINIKLVENKFYINGILNKGIEWMQELGYSHACIFHDDVVFSPLENNHISKWFGNNLEAAGITFSFIQAFSNEAPKRWLMTPEEWDRENLESIELWETLSESISYLKNANYCLDNTAKELKLDNWFAQYYCLYHTEPTMRLGPAGQIINIEKWNQLGRFDESYGIFYDIQYPSEAKINGETCLMIPNVPFLHLHNQSIGISDLANGIWTNQDKAFKNKYGKTYIDLWSSPTQVIAAI